MNASALEQRLLSQGGSFEFRQVIRLLRRLRADGLASVRVRPALSLDLARAEVAGIAADERGRLTVETTFLGLYGSASPLPTFYTEELIEAGQDDRQGSRDFLDLIHQRLYALYAEALEKYRPLYGSIEQGADRFETLLASLIGLRDPALRAAVPASDRLLPLAGLLMGRQRSAEGLACLLEALLEDVPVSVEQCVSRTLAVPARARLRLGEQAHRLGADAVLGSRIDDASGRLRLRLGPVSAERFQQLLSPEHWAFLLGVVRFYLPTPLECELVCVLEAEAPVGARLGEAGGLLGRDAWLGGGDQRAATMTLE